MVYGKDTYVTVAVLLNIVTNFTSTINQQMHLYNFHLKHF